MKNKKFIVGTSVIVTLRDGKEIRGKIVGVDINLRTQEEGEYSVDYVNEGKLWTIIGVPASNIRLA